MPATFNCHPISTPEDPLDGREEATAGPLLLLVPPDSFPVALVLGRGWELVYLDLHDLVALEIAEDELPRHLGHAHELIGEPDEQLDAVAVKLAQLGPELEHIIDRILSKATKKSD